MFGCVRQGSTDGASGSRVRSPRKQRVQLQLMELEGVTLSNGVLFAKVRLLGGGRFCQYSARKEIRDNKVTWTDQGPMEFAFRCASPSAGSTATSAPAATSATATPALRVSVRKEERGGRSYSKLGYAVLDLAGLSPGGDPTEHSCILSPYSQHQRLDNSRLRLRLRRLACQQPQQQPQPQSSTSPATAAAAEAAAPLPPAVAASTVAAAATDAEASSAAAAAAESTVGDQLAVIAVDAAAAAAPHRRNPSSFSYASMLTHSRTNSLDQEALMFPATSSQSSSVPSFDLLPSSLERKRAAPTPSRELSSRIANTRTDNYKLVREVLEQEGIRLVGPDASG